MSKCDSCALSDNCTGECRFVAAGWDDDREYDEIDAEEFYADELNQEGDEDDGLDM